MTPEQREYEIRVRKYLRSSAHCSILSKPETMLGEDNVSRRVARARANAVAENNILRSLVLPQVVSRATMYQIEWLLAAVKTKGVTVGVWTKNSDVCLEAIARTVRRDPLIIRALNFADSDMTDAGVRILADILRAKTCKLEVVHIYREPAITHVGYAALADALRTNTSLRRLRINEADKTDGNVNVMAMCTALRKYNRTLMRFEYIDSGVEDSGGRALSAMLKTNKTLVSLDVSFNEMGDESFEAIAEAMRENRKLRFLRMNYNAQTSRGVIAVARAVETNEQLFECGIDTNDHSTNTVEASMACYWSAFMMPNMQFYDCVRMRFVNACRKYDAIWCLRNLRELRKKHWGVGSLPSSAVCHIASYLIPSDGHYYGGDLYRAVVERARRENIF